MSSTAIQGARATCWDMNGLRLREKLSTSVHRVPMPGGSVPTVPGQVSGDWPEAGADGGEDSVSLPRLP